MLSLRLIAARHSGWIQIHVWLSFELQSLSRNLRGQTSPCGAPQIPSLGLQVRLWEMASVAFSFPNVAPES
jgi:hypothetical protein